MNYSSFEVSKHETRDIYKLLIGAVVPRPIAWVGSKDKDGNINLAPFSYFNVVSAAPPVLIFSPNISSQTGKSKDTLNNLLETKECSVSIPPAKFLDACNLSSKAFPPDVNEFAETKMQTLPSEVISVPGVSGCPAIFECRLMHHLPLGSGRGSGQLMVLEVVFIRILDSVLDEQGELDPHKVDSLARLGANWWMSPSKGYFRQDKP